MMRIEHVAVWANDIEVLCQFYETYFGAQTNFKYTNHKKQYQSYFLTFASGARLELMQRPDIRPKPHQAPTDEFVGYAHLAMAVGSAENVNILTQKLIDDGYQRIDGPRHTGDGYYESVILDPEGNRIEITI